MVVYLFLFFFCFINACFSNFSYRSDNLIRASWNKKSVGNYLLEVNILGTVKFVNFTNEKKNKLMLKQYYTYAKIMKKVKSTY